ncbi:MAG: Lrp/AsnC ligand binding domain-containing protein [Dokdonella sp.]|nr:Lrp/AsnC ligand binding domain-containing protein [Dokdonella sp.]
MPYRGTGADSFTIKAAVASIEDLEHLIDRLTPFGTTSTSIVLSSPVPSRALAPPPQANVDAASGRRRR